MKVYRNYSQAELDAGYDNTNAVADSARLLAEFDAHSAAVAAAMPQYLDLRYGQKERNRIDFFACGDKAAPLLIFIHGGYWQMRCKETFRFLAEAAVAAGYHCALPGYTLAPDASLTDIVAEMRAAVGWLAEHAPVPVDRMIVSGWSAGGELAALMLDEPQISGAIGISGIYDLQPIALSFLNRKLRLSDAEIARFSPLRRPMANKPMLMLVGGAELPELQRQSWDFARERARRGMPGGAWTLAEANHFTILPRFAALLPRILPSVSF